MKFNRKFMLIIIIFFLAVGIISLVYTFVLAPEIEEFDMYLTIGDYAGFNVATDAIYFGTIPPGEGGSRKILFENDNFYFSEKVKISASGELAEWVWTEENNFVLDKSESKRVRVHVSSPKDAEFGNYTGKLKITFRKIYISPQLF